MKVFKYLSALVFIAITSNSFAQSKQDSTIKLNDHRGAPITKKQNNYYRKALGVDSITAEKVSIIQDNYKSEMTKLISDKGLARVDRLKKMDLIRSAKNRQLEKILNANQLQRMIPSSEREQHGSEKKN
jgi:hypothetical protein